MTTRVGLDAHHRERPRGERGLPVSVVRERPLGMVETVDAVFGGGVADEVEVHSEQSIGAVQAFPRSGYA